MSNETVVWGTKVGEPDWKETVIYGGGKVLSEEQLKQCKAWATENGFDRLRVKTFNPFASVPDFTKAINV